MIADAFITLLFFLSGSDSHAVVVPGSASQFDLVSPAVKLGLDATTGNWVDRNLVTWSKIAKPVADYESAKMECANKIKTDSLQWQLPTPEQAESFYLRAANRPAVLTKNGWVLGPIFLLSDGADKRSEAADLASGTLYLDGYTGKSKVAAQCVALPQGFDKSGNYFDGKLIWSKTTAKSYSIADATKKCADMTSGFAAGTWKLPTFEQLDTSLAQPLQVSEQFRQKMKKNGWAFGTALVQGDSSLGNYKLLYSSENSHIVTCVH